MRNRRTISSSGCGDGSATRTRASPTIGRVTTISSSSPNSAQLRHWRLRSKQACAAPAPTTSATTAPCRPTPRGAAAASLAALEVEAARQAGFTGAAGLDPGEDQARTLAARAWSAAVRVAQVLRYSGGCPALIEFDARGPLRQRDAAIHDDRDHQDTSITEDAARIRIGAGHAACVLHGGVAGGGCWRATPRVITGRPGCCGCQYR
jgi:hypothetical protein